MKITRFLVVVLAVLVLGTGGYFAYKNFYSPNKTNFSEPVEIPFSILNNKYGFLSGGPESNDSITSVGASWLRPHPGPFLWMQCKRQTQLK